MLRASMEAAMLNMSVANACIRGSLFDLDENHPTDLAEEAVYMRDTVFAAMNDVRAVADTLERTVADDLWPLPRYSEMLFIK